MWIALEGGEGSGKSTQASVLAGAFGAVLTREPGGTPLGASIRSLLLDPASVVDARTEALLMAADRAQHVASVVRPALAAGRRVVSDRSAWSSLAYQGYGRGLDVDWLWQLSDWAMDGTWPDLAILVSVPADVASGRMGARPRDRMEQSGADFHGRVSAGFAHLAERWADRWAVVDGTGTVDDVAQRIRSAVEARMRAPRASRSETPGAQDR